MNAITPDFRPHSSLRSSMRTSGYRPLSRGADLSYGRKLPRLLRAAGLVDVEADAYFPLTSSACNTLERATVEQIRASLVAGGFATEEEVARHLGNIASGLLDLATSPLVSAWGRRC